MEVLGEKLEGFSHPPTATAFTGFGFAVPDGAIEQEEGLSVKELWGLAWQRVVMQVGFVVVHKRVGVGVIPEYSHSGGCTFWAECF